MRTAASGRDDLHDTIAAMFQLTQEGRQHLGRLSFGVVK
jgi:hypothetical protein